jgi:hypothetical protein
MGWEVGDIEREVANLKARGAVFEGYDSPNLKTVNSNATTGPNRAAWFKDSEGQHPWVGTTGVLNDCA